MKQDFYDWACIVSPGVVAAVGPDYHQGVAELVGKTAAKHDRHKAKVHEGRYRIVAPDTGWKGEIVVLSNRAEKRFLVMTGEEKPINENHDYNSPGSSPYKMTNAEWAADTGADAPDGQNKHGGY